MSTRDPRTLRSADGLHAAPPRPSGPAARPARSSVTADGAEWLASASVFPRSVHALWQLRPQAPSVLPCGRAFDVVSTSPLYGRRLLDRLGNDGHGSGPVAVHRGRLLLFTTPGTAQRLPVLLAWEEWAHAGSGRLLCHGHGDVITVPSLHPVPGAPAGREGSRWLVAPEVRAPWLPGAEALVRACAHSSRALSSGGTVLAGRGGSGARAPIFAPGAGDATVYDVSRRR